MIEDLRVIAEDEIERAAEEAVKAAVTETGAELAAQEARADSYAALCERLETENAALLSENGRLKRRGLKEVLCGTAAGAGLGAAAASLLFLLCGGR